MEKLYSKGYVCYLRSSKMNDLIANSAYDNCKLTALKKISAAYVKMQNEFDGRNIVVDSGLMAHSSLFSNQMFISFIKVGDDGNGLTENNMRFVFGEIRRVLSFFRNEGVILEGGVSYDDVYHSGNIIIGPAVVKAVLITQKGKEGVWLDNSITGFTNNNVLLEDGISWVGEL